MQLGNEKKEAEI